MLGQFHGECRADLPAVKRQAACCHEVVNPQRLGGGRQRGHGGPRAANRSRRLPGAGQEPPQAGRLVMDGGDGGGCTGTEHQVADGDGELPLVAGPVEILPVAAVRQRIQALKAAGGVRPADASTWWRERW